MKVNIRVRHHGSINIEHHRECQRTLFARIIFVRLDSDISFYKPLAQVFVNDQVTNHGRVNGDQRRWVYQPWVVFYRQTPYLAFLSLEFIEKQTKSVFSNFRPFGIWTMSVKTQPMSDSGVLFRHFRTTTSDCFQTSLTESAGRELIRF